MQQTTLIAVVSTTKHSDFSDITYKLNLYTCIKRHRVTWGDNKQALVQFRAINMRFQYILLCIALIFTHKDQSLFVSKC